MRAITFRDMEELNFPYQLNQLSQKGKNEIYHLPDTYIDDYFIYSTVFQKELFLRNSTLVTWSFTTVPFEPVMTSLWVKHEANERRGY